MWTDICSLRLQIFSRSFTYVLTIMDTQGMSSPIKGDKRVIKQYKPYKAKVIPAFTDNERKELKEIIREVLDEYL